MYVYMYTFFAQHYLQKCYFDLNMQRIIIIVLVIDGVWYVIKDV